MSQAVTCQQFCDRYKLDPEKDASRKEYEKYCDGLNLANNLFADDITQQAIEKAKNNPA